MWGRAKRNPQRSLNSQGSPWQWNYWWLLVFFHFPFSSFAQFSKMNINICCCLIRGESCSFSGSLSCMPKTERCVISCAHLASCWPAEASTGLGRPPAHQLGSAGSPWHPVPLVLPRAVPIEGTAFHRPHTKEDRERVCAQCKHVSSAHPNHPPLRTTLWKTPTGSHWAKPLASRHNS